MRAITSLAVSLLLALGAAGCSNSTTSPTTTTTTPTSPFTVTFASALAQGGSTTRTFVTSTSGTIKLTLASLGTGAQKAGIGVGITTTAAPCSLAQSVITLPGSSPQISLPADQGTYCVQIFDVGTLVDDTPFSLTVEYP